MRITRRKFLELGAGVAAGFFLKPYLLLGQEKPKIPLEEKLLTDEFTKKEKEWLNEINNATNSALKAEPFGKPLASHKVPVTLNWIDNQYGTFKRREEDANVNLKFEYFNAGKNYGGALRAYVYLDKKDWFSKKGLAFVKLITYSTYGSGAGSSKPSKKIFELNVNNHYKYINDCEIKHRVIEGDYFPELLKKPVFALLKKAKVKKKDLNQIFAVGKILSDIKDHKLQQKILDKGRRITGGTVDFNVFDFFGYGFFDSRNFVGSLRQPLVVRYEFGRGEDRFEALGFIITLVDFKPEYSGKQIIGYKTALGQTDHFMNFSLNEMLMQKGYKKIIGTEEQE